MNENYFETEAELFKHLLDGGIIRPHFKSERTNKSSWVALKDGNRVYIETGKSASNCLIGLEYWVNAGHVEDFYKKV